MNLSIKLCFLAFLSINVAFSQVLQDSDQVSLLGAGTEFRLMKDLVIKANTTKLPLATERFTQAISTSTTNQLYITHRCYLEFDSAKQSRIIKKDITKFTLKDISIVHDNEMKLTFEEFMTEIEDDVNTEEDESDTQPSLSLNCHYQSKLDSISSPNPNKVYSLINLNHQSEKITFRDFKRTLTNIFEIVEAEPIEF